MEFDLVISNGTVIDGTGRPRFRADLGLCSGKIATISTDAPLSGRKRLDASSLVLAPGFIDIHSHSDWILPLPEHKDILAPLVLQGITTVVTGNCGFSPAPVTDETTGILDGISRMLRDHDFPYRWRSFREFLETLERDGLLLNAAFLVGHGSLRSLVMGNRSDLPTPEEMAELRRLTRQSLDEGAFGFSAGLAYAPGVFAKNEELLALLQVVAEMGAVFTVHGRAYTWVSPFYQPMFLGAPHNLRSVRELLGLARQAKVKLELSHQIFVGRNTWRTYPAVMKEIDRAAGSGLDVAFDAFPYTVGNSTINVVFPEWFLDGFKKNVNDPASLRRLKREMDLLRFALGFDYSDMRLMTGEHPELQRFEGLDFVTIARQLGLPVFEAYMRVARYGESRILLGAYSGDGDREEPLRAALSHPLCSIMTDTILVSRGAANPASHGAFPRLLGCYSRDLGLFPLEEAVRRMTTLPAERIGLKGTGRIAEGNWADLVLFDPLTVADNTTPEHADALPSGIRAVLISGEVVAQDGKMVAKKQKGRVMRR
jgi:N-acyl-D-amino-acid deacylase